MAIFGVSGRMGQSLIRALIEPPQTGVEALQLGGATASARSNSLGADAAQAGVATGVMVTSDPVIAVRGTAVAVDFSVPQSVAANAAACVAANVPLLVGTTGLDAATCVALKQAASRIAVLIAPNTSLGVNVLMQLAALAATHLSADYDIEIAEAHHRMKRDAPSGTALALGEVVAQSRGVQLVDAGVYARHGATEARRPGSIGFSVVRAGDIVGEHTVIFAGAGERIEITHRATDRMTFARGALRAADWLRSQPPGEYSMQNFLEA